MGDPALSIVYKCTVDGFIPLGIWTQDRGPRLRVRRLRVPRGRGQRLHPQAPRSRASTRTSGSPGPSTPTPQWLAMWLQLPDGQGRARRRCRSAPSNSAGEEITTWNLAGVVPGKWTGPDARHHGQRDRDRDPRGRLRADHRASARSAAPLAGAITAPAPSGSEDAAMVMDAVGSAASAVGDALGLIKPEKAKLVVVSDNKPQGRQRRSSACSTRPSTASPRRQRSPGRTAPSSPAGPRSTAATNPMTAQT